MKAKRTSNNLTKAEQAKLAKAFPGGRHKISGKVGSKTLGTAKGK